MQSKSDLEPVTIVVMGSTGAGKSTFINLVSGSNPGMTVNDGLTSGTERVQFTAPFMPDGRPVTLIDTPGFNDASKDEGTILRLVAEALAQTYKDGRKVNGIIYLHRISDVRMGGMAQQHFRLVRKLCGETNLKRVVIVTTMWDTTPRDLATKRENSAREDMAVFQTALAQGAQLRRHDNTIASAHRILRTVMGFPAEILRIQQELVEEGKTLDRTDASTVLDFEVARLEEKFLRELEAAKKQHEAELAARIALEQREKQALSARLAETTALLEQLVIENKALVDALRAEREASEESRKRQAEEISKRDEDLRQERRANAARLRQAEQMKRAADEEARKKEEQLRKEHAARVRELREAEAARAVAAARDAARNAEETRKKALLGSLLGFAAGVSGAAVVGALL